MTRSLRWKNWTMRCQILSIDFLILFIITGAVTLISYLNIRLVVPYLQQSSEELYLKISSNLINSNLYEYEQIILRILSMNGNQLITLNQLYTKAHDLVRSQSEIILNDNLNMNYLGTNPFPSMLETEEGFEGKKTSNCFICYTNLTNLPDPLTEDYLVEIKIQEYMQAFGQIIYQGNLTKQFFFYGATEKTDFNIIYPCLHRAETIYSYKPKTRNWYQDAKALYESSNLTTYQFKVTKPYLLYTAQFVGQSIYIPMINKEKEFIGAWGTNIYSQEMSKFVKNNNFLKMALLLDEDGILVVHNFPNVTLEDLPLYIYREDKTGFNEEDWKYMKKMDKQSIESTCTSFNKQFKELLCAYNSYYKEEVLIGINYLQSYNLFLIILYDTQQFFHFQEMRQSIIEDTFQTYVTFLIEIYSISSIVGTLIVIIAIIIITRPIKIIIKSIKSKVNNGVYHLQDLNLFDMIVVSPEIQNLYLSYEELLIKFSDFAPHHKNQICSEIEQIQEYETLIYYFNFEQNIHDSRCMIKLFDSHSFCKRFQDEERIKAVEIIQKANAQLMSKNKKLN